MRVLAGLLLAALLGCGGAPRSDDGAASPDAVKAYVDASMLARAGRLLDAAERYDAATALDPKSAQVWMAAARVRARLSQWDEAAARAEQAGALDPTNPQIRDELGRIYLAAQRTDEARTLYERRLAAEPRDAAAWNGYGGLLLSAGDVEAAADALQKAVEIDPSLAEAWERLGHARLQAGRQVPAAKAYDEAAARDPERRHLDRLVLSLALDGGDVELARRAAGRMAGDKAPPGTPSVALARLLIDKGDLLGAANELEWVLERHPDITRARLMLGQVQARVGRDEDARRQLEGIDRDDALRPDAARLLAFLAMRRDDFAAAESLLREARAGAPGESEIPLDLARVQRHRGDRVGARATLAEALARFPNDAELLYTDALLRFDAGDGEGAIAGMQKVLAAEEGHAGALNFIGFTWAERGERLDEAEKMIRRALEARPDDGAIVDSLGWVLFRQGRHEEAEATLRRAVELAPKEAEIRFHLGEVLVARGRRGEGLDELEAAVKLATDAPERRKYEKRRDDVRRGKK